MRSVESHQIGTGAADLQAGIISRQQLLSFGWTSARISHQMSTMRWQVLLPGVYATFTGEVPIQAWWWAAHLHAGPESVLHGRSALEALGVLAAQLPALIAVPRPKHVRYESSQVSFVSVSARRAVRIAPCGVPAARVADAVLDEVAGYTDRTAMFELISEAFTSRHLSLPELRNALATRNRHPHRKDIEKLIAELADGVTSSLERSGVSRVLKAHGLPAGKGQVRERVNGKLVIRDRVLEPYGVVVEFDGRRGHANPRGRMRDIRRDRAVSRSRRSTIRLGWQDVEEDACLAAAEVAQLLSQHGWLGVPAKCAENCSVLHHLGL